MAELENEYEDDLEGFEDDEADGLPKRNKGEYLEIERFQPYELTQCVAYEMGIRNVVIKGLIAELKYFSERKSYLINGNQATSHPVSEKYEKYSKLGILHLNELIEEHEKHLIDEYLLYPHEYDNESKEISNYLAIRKALNNTSEKPEYDYKWNNSDNQGYRIYQGIFTNSKTYDISHVFTNFKRQVKYVNKAEVTLNMALPKDEILAYIEHVLDTLSSSNEKQLKSSLELLFGEIFDKAEKTNNFPRKLKASKMADLLFIYDYIKARQKQINQYNEDEEIEYSKDIYAIQSNKELSGSDKKTQIAELNRVHNDNQVNTLITDICNESKLLQYLNVQGAMVLKYYYAIRPYIEEYKYKELIIGAALSSKKQD
jgi:hypothetical protein